MQRWRRRGPGRAASLSPKETLHPRTRPSPSPSPRPRLRPRPPREPGAGMQPTGEPGEGGLLWADQGSLEAYPPSKAPGWPRPGHQRPELPDRGEARRQPGHLQSHSRYPCPLFFLYSSSLCMYVHTYIYIHAGPGWPIWTIWTFPDGLAPYWPAWLPINKMQPCLLTTHF